VKDRGFDKTLKRADDAVRQALSIKPQLASAFAAKSNLLAYSTKDDYRGEIAQAIEAAEAALALNPNRPGTSE
jgi:adenylate cyclase